MSLLMEALRKAEEAKRKAAEDDTRAAAGSDGTLAPDAPASQEQPAQDSAMESSAGPDRPLEFSLQQQTDSPPEPDAPEHLPETAPEHTDTADTAAEMQLYPMGAEDGPAEVQPAPDVAGLAGAAKDAFGRQPLTVSEQPVDPQQLSVEVEVPATDSPPQGQEQQFGRFQSDYQREQPQPVSRKRPTRLLVLLALLLLVGGVFYWFFSGLGNNAGSIAAPSAVDLQSRGFLGQPAGDTAAAEQAAVQPLSPDLPAIAAETEPPAENAVAPGAPVVGELLSQPAPVLTADEAATANPQQQAAPVQASVFRINPPQPAAQASLERQLLEAAALLGGADYRGAASAYADILALHPTSPVALVGLARALAAAGDTAAASDAYRRLLLLDPRSLEARLGLLQLDHQLDATARELALSNLADDYPADASVAYALGNLYARQSRWSEASSAYARAVQRAEQGQGAAPADYYFNLAVSHERLNNPAAALSNYQQAKARLGDASNDSLPMALLDARLASLEAQLR